MLRTQSRMRVCVTLLIINLLFIWGNSMLPGDVSKAFSNWVKGLLEALFPKEGRMNTGGFLIRKLAHFSEFAALGLWLGWLFAMLNKGKLLPLCIGIGAACLDEIIQYFVPGRGPGVRDVLIDSSGVLTGVLLVRLLRRLSLRHHHHLEEP